MNVITDTTDGNAVVGLSGCGDVMKKIAPLFALIFILQLNASRPDLTHYFAGLDATFVLLNGKTNQFIRYNPNRAAQRFSPCSTFKIPHTALLLESGVAPGADYELKYDPVYTQPPQWAQDFTLAGAFKASALWYYQVLAQRAGMSVEQRFVDQFAYGNRDTRTGLKEIGHTFWVDGTLRISANEQVMFLRRFYERKLGLSERTTGITKQIMLVEERPNYRLSAKTGACQHNREQTANWYVGYVEKPDRIYYFALEMGDKDYGRAYSERISITRTILTDLGILK
jgi:beta-lactamase class D